MRRGDGIAWRPIAQAVFQHPPRPGTDEDHRAFLGKGLTASSIMSRGEKAEEASMWFALVLWICSICALLVRIRKKKGLVYGNTPATSQQRPRSATRTPPPRSAVDSDPRQVRCRATRRIAPATTRIPARSARSPAVARSPRAR